jgi:hypothetical protein
MTSTAASMHFVIVFNQSSEFSSSCRRCSVSAMGYSMRSEGKHSAVVPAFHDDIHRICIGQRTDGIQYIDMVRPTSHRCDFV